jgi:hypothetical protein
MMARLNKVMQVMQKCVYSITCECGGCCTGKPERLLRVSMKKNTAQVGSMHVESNNFFRKYKELTHMACVANLISHTILDICPVWFSVI